MPLHLHAHFLIIYTCTCISTSFTITGAYAHYLRLHTNIHVICIGARVYARPYPCTSTSPSGEAPAPFALTPLPAAGPARRVAPPSLSRMTRPTRVAGATREGLAPSAGREMGAARLARGLSRQGKRGPARRSRTARRRPLKALPHDPPKASQGARLAGPPSRASRAVPAVRTHCLMDSDRGGYSALV